MAHAGADTDSAVRQGFFGIFEVFADTMILCTLTAFVLLLHIHRFPGLTGMEFVIAAFEISLGKLAAPLLAILIFSFAVATMIGWSHYGRTCLVYLTGGHRQSELYKKLYALAYSLMGIFGALTGGNLMWLLADYSVALMTLIHLPCMLSKIKEVAAVTRSYFAQSARSLENTLAPEAERANSKDL
jgi:AGCS family alanine or glycine:cation symporter